MAKGINAAAVTGVFRYVASRPEHNKCILLLIDDRIYNHNDSENTCWLYELDYTPLNNENIDSLIFAGARYKDHILRAQMSGLNANKIQTNPIVKNSSDLIDTSKYTNIYILFGAYEIEGAAREKARLLKRGVKK